MSVPAVDDIAGWLEAARDAEAGLRLDERTAALDRVEILLELGAPEPAGRSWRCELLAERAIDLTRHEQLSDAAALARRILAEAPTEALLARARATEALGRALAWEGTDATTADARRTLNEAAELDRQLGRTEWQGYMIHFRGSAVHLLTGDLPEAANCMTQALALLAADSPRRALVLSFYCDPLVALGRWDEALWRLQMFTAFATLRAGGSGVGDLVTRALELAVASGGIEVATPGEPELTAALLPTGVATNAAPTATPAPRPTLNPRASALPLARCNDIRRPLPVSGGMLPSPGWAPIRAPDRS